MVDIFPVRHVVEGNTMVEKTLIMTPEVLTIVEDNGKTKTEIQYVDITNCIMIDSGSIGMKVKEKTYFMFTNEAPRFVEVLTSYKH
ncbi:hypothetical protein KM1_126060 [Entamoeba histolytica HM-3:IMSS]|nr:hypothetical protein KM1_126060 [Entamoeba histolytica HM-3:IMSS]